jgi:chromosome segregation ATPase
LKWEHWERDLVTLREDFRIIEIEQTKLHETITKKTEELRHVVIEKERIDEEYHSVCQKVEESHRQVLDLHESLRRTESTVKEKTELIHTLNERIERIERERDEGRHKCSDLSIELSELQTRMLSLKVEIEAVTGERESFCEKLRECQTRYEEIQESYTDDEEGRSGTEYALNNLRTMLREAREQKEQAIAMRSTADRERDEATKKYEEQCRKNERLKEEFGQQFHSHGRTGGRTTTRHAFKGSRSVSTAHEYEEDE